jgi:hypothetical protein
MPPEHHDEKGAGEILGDGHSSGPGRHRRCCGGQSESA